MWDLIVSVPDHCLSFYSTLFTENTRKMGMILLMTDYNKEPIATGSIIKRCYKKADRDTY